MQKGENFSFYFPNRNLSSKVSFFSARKLFDCVEFIIHASFLRRISIDPNSKSAGNRRKKGVGEKEKELGQSSRSRTRNVTYGFSAH